MLLEDQILAHPMGEAHRVGHEERPTVGRRMGLSGNQSERSVNPRSPTTTEQRSTRRRSRGYERPAAYSASRSALNP
jgi:hypothetical protein